MLPGPTHRPPVPSLRTVQVIVAALIAGLVIFAVVAVSIGRLSSSPPSSPPSPMQGLVPMAALGFLVLMALLWAIAPRFIIWQTRANVRRMLARSAQTNDPAAAAAIGPTIFAAYVNMCLTRAGMLEAPGFLGCISILLTGDLLGLAPVAVVVALIAATFPTQDRAVAMADQVLGNPPSPAPSTFPR